MIKLRGRFKPKPKPKALIARQEAYRNDKAYRTRIQQVSRNNYRKKNQVELSTCLYSLPFLEQLAKERDVITAGGKEINCLVFSIPQTALALQKIYQTVWRWVKKGQLPAPVLFLASRGEPVYHIEEVRIFIEEIGEHEKEIKYFRLDHEDVVNRIFKRTERIRIKLGLTKRK